MQASLKVALEEVHLLCKEHEYTQDLTDFQIAMKNVDTHISLRIPVYQWPTLTEAGNTNWGKCQNIGNRKCS